MNYNFFFKSWIKQNYLLNDIIFNNNEILIWIKNEQDEHLPLRLISRINLN